jgi:hypothetical protein
MNGQCPKTEAELPVVLSLVVSLGLILLTIFGLIWKAILF